MRGIGVIGMMEDMLRTLLLFAGLTALAFSQTAPTADVKTIAGNLRIRQAQVASVLQRSIDKMPEENFAFKPVETVRSFGELASHVSEAQYAFCSAALGEKMPAIRVPATGTKARTFGRVCEGGGLLRKGLSAGDGCVRGGNGEAVRQRHDARRRAGIQHGALI